MEQILKKISDDAAFQRLSSLCATAEYCLFDMRRKMERWDLTDQQKARLLKRLVAEKYVDENRYAHAFVRDKSRYNKWGAKRIEFELRKRHIDDDDIRDALTELQELDTDDMLINLLRQKAKTVKYCNEYELLTKLMRFAAGRGFSADDFNRCIKQALLEKE